MNILLAPSKTMTFHAPVLPGVKLTSPYFRAQASEIVHAVRKLDDLTELMHASAAICERTRVLYQDWGSGAAAGAIYAYVGDVYKGMYASTLTTEDLAWAQQHVFILSGLYGALRPLDQISAYRLEMRAKLPVGQAKHLYDYWGDRVARYVESTADGIICVLSSDEYAKVVTAQTSARIVAPVFLDKKPNGKIGTVPIYSKMMRGVMARWMIDRRIEEPDQLQAFSMHGYSYDSARSTPDRPAFYREVMTPLTF